MSISVDPLTLLDKEALARRLSISTALVSKLVAAKRIPVIKLGWRTQRFSWPAVEKAMTKLTILEATR